MGLPWDWLSSDMFLFENFSPQSIKNQSNILSDFSQNPQKSSRNPSRRLAKKANVAHNAIFSTFLDFRRFSKGPCAPFGLQNLKKIETKSPSKIFSFFTSIFHRFFTDLASQNATPVQLFLNFFRKRRFCENRAPV